MSDNTRLPAGTADGDTYASDDIAGVKIQRVKIVLGADGTNDGDVATANPIPVTGTVTVGSHAVTNAGTFAVQDSEKVADNAGFTDGTTKLQPAGYILDETAGTALTENDAAAARIDSKRAQVLTLEDATTRGRRATVSAGGALSVDASGAAVPVTDNSGSLTVDNGGTFAVQASIAAAQTLATVTTVGTITNVVHVDDNSGNLSIDDGGNSITVDGTITASIAAGASTIAKAEDVASADADVGVPAMAIQKASPANTAGTDGDYAMLQMSAGRLWASATVDAALPAGSNAIGKLASNSGVTIGAVEVAAAQTLSTVTTLGTITNVVHVDDNSGSLTVDNGGTFAVQAAATEADGANVTLGAKADAKSTATDTTAVTAMSVLKQISASVQAPPSQAVTNAGTFAVQAAATEADGANVTLGAKADAKSTATDTTAVTAMSVLKQISASVQAPPSQAVTNAGTFAVQAAATEADGANVTLGAKADAKSTATDTTAVTAMSVLKQISASVQAPPSQAVTNAGTFAVQAAATEADGANVTLGAKADAKSTATDTTAVTAMSVLKQISASVQAPPSQAVTNTGTFAVQCNETPDATSTYAPTNATVSAYATNLVVKASAGVLFNITGYNSRTTTQFIQLHNTTSLPADTSVPAVIFLVSGSSNFSFDVGGKFGRFFSTGITICNSSTGPTKTIGSADCWFDVQYK